MLSRAKCILTDMDDKTAGFPMRPESQGVGGGPPCECTR